MAGIPTKCRHGWRAALILSALAAELSLYTIKTPAPLVVAATPFRAKARGEEAMEVTAAVKGLHEETPPVSQDGAAGRTAETVVESAVAARSVMQQGLNSFRLCEISASQRHSCIGLEGGRVEVTRARGDGNGGNEEFPGPGCDRGASGCVRGVEGESCDVQQPFSIGLRIGAPLPDISPRRNNIDDAGAAAAIDGWALSGAVEPSDSRTTEERNFGARVADPGRDGEKTEDTGTTQKQRQRWRRRGRREAAADEGRHFSDSPRSSGASEAPAEYIVQWTDFHPLEDHLGLLSLALGEVDRCSGGGGGVEAGSADSGTRPDDNVGGIGCSGSGSMNTGGETGHGQRISCSNGDGDDRTEGGVHDDRCPCDCCWELVERKNAGAFAGEYPSDFSLVRWKTLRYQRVKSSKIANDHHSGQQRATPLGDLPTACEDRQSFVRGEGHWEGSESVPHEGVPSAEAGVQSGDVRRNARGEGISGGLPCARAAGALRSSPLVKGVHRDQALMRGVSAVSEFDIDALEPEDGLLRSRDSSGGVETKERSFGPAEAATPGAQQKQDFSHHLVVDSIEGGKQGVRTGKAAGTDSDVKIEPNEEFVITGGAAVQERQLPQQQQQWWPGGEAGGEPQRRLDGGPAAAAGGVGVRLRGSSKGEFVDAAQQGKPLHDQGFKGEGIRVAIFDTGLEAGGHDFGNVLERINWTDEETLEDRVGHGTHVAGVIGGRDPGCSGFAPEADLFVFRVFSSEQVSYTSWFLDAFNYALFLGVDVINLSIGGPDFKDQPFVDKVRELSANGIVIVSAVGNDGPLHGTHHNPADQMDTIGVGAASATGRGVASFQSRGMTTWELPGGYGRVKPDLVAVGQHVLGPTAGGAFGHCSGLSGTSVASPVVAGAVALLASTVPHDRRRDVLNPASIKQVLTESALRVTGAGVFEQGAGVLNVMGAFKLLSVYKPRASLLPPELDLTDPYMWPFSRQPLYYGAQPVMFNVTVANGMGVTGHITSLVWTEERVQRPEGGGNVLDIRAEFSEILWPWSGYLALSLTVSESGRDFQGLVLGKLEVTVESEAGPGETKSRITNVVLPVAASVVRTPSRDRRLLWDQFHSVPYPPNYAPRDYLGDYSDMLDRLGDHPHTNFRTLFESLLDAGYYVEVLGSSWSCFDAENYGALLLVDSEAELGHEEKAKLEMDVKENGLSVVVFADWYNPDVMSRVRFVDDNTRMPWDPVTGGSNVPALNDFLFRAFGMALGGTVLDGMISLPGGEVHLASGNGISRMPPGGLLVFAATLRGASTRKQDGNLSFEVLHSDVPVIGAFDTNRIPSSASSESENPGGRLFLFGDSSCADDVAFRSLNGTLRGGDERRGAGSDCLWLFKSAVRYACEGYIDHGVFRDAQQLSVHNAGGFHSFALDAFSDGSGMGGYSDGHPLPERPDAYELDGSRRTAREVQSIEPMEFGDADQCSLNRFRMVPSAAAS